MVPGPVTWKLLKGEWPTGVSGEGFEKYIQRWHLGHSPDK